MSMDEIDAHWQRLDPVFVRGMQRSGTSVMARALQQLGVLGFGEGHLWFELVKPLERLLDPSYCPTLRDDSYALGQGREVHLARLTAVCLDRFHRENLPKELTRWMDKSPGAEPVRVAPLLADLFPCSQFVFVLRSGITTVYSGCRLWAHDPGVFERLCAEWKETMSAWREARQRLDGRYVEVRQEEMAANPRSTAAILTDFLNVEESLPAVASVFATERVESAFPDKAAGDYDYRPQWTLQQKAHFTDVCGEEMEIWGYELDFDSPGVARTETSEPDLRCAPPVTLAQPHASHLGMEPENQISRECSSRMEHGRAARCLNHFKWWKSKLFDHRRGSK